MICPVCQHTAIPSLATICPNCSANLVGIKLLDALEDQYVEYYQIANTKYFHYNNMSISHTYIAKIKMSKGC